MHSIHGALTQDRPFVQHRHLLGGLSDEFHVVLNDEDGVILRHALQELGRFFTFLAGHTSDRLIEQQQGRILSHDHADLQPLQLTMRQRPRPMMRLLQQAESLQDGTNLIDLRGSQRAQQRRPERPTLGQGERKIFKQSQLFEHRGRLEFTPDAKRRDLIGLERTQVGRVAENDPSCIGLDLAADDVEQSGFASAVRSNQGAEFAAIHVQINPP